MRILNLINSARPEGGGPIEAIRQAHRVLTGEGHVYELASLDDPSSEWLKDFNIKTYALGPAYTSYRYAPRCLPWLIDNSAHYDCIIVHGLWLYPSLAACRASRKTGIPYFIYSHGLLDPAFHRIFPAKRFKKQIAWKLLEHRVVRDAAGMLFTGVEESMLAAGSYKPYSANPVIAPYCVGAPPGDSAEQKEIFLDKYPELSERGYILFLSRIHPKKGCDLLIEAFGKMPEHKRPGYIVMAGPEGGEYQAHLQKRAVELGVGERVIWTGMLSGDMKWGAFRAADAFILPTRQENFGIAIVEALACGTPVLITERTNIWREISDSGAGLVGTDTVEAVEGMLGQWQLMSSPEKDRYRENAVKCFTTRFADDVAAVNLLDRLRENGVKDNGTT